MPPGADSKTSVRVALCRPTIRPPAPGASRRRAHGTRWQCALSYQRPVRDAAEEYSDRGGNVADGVKGLVVADDLENVGGLRSAKPPTCIDRDPEIAPVFHTEDRGTVNQIGAGVREKPRRFCTDDAPVANRNEFGLVATVGQTQMGEH